MRRKLPEPCLAQFIRDITYLPPFERHLALARLDACRRIQRTLALRASAPAEDAAGGGGRE